MRRTLGSGLLLALALAGVVSASHAQAEPGFSIVVHESNPLGGISRSELSRIFLKKTLSWTNGVQCLPIDLDESSRVRGEFSKEVLKKRVAAVNAYWQQMIFSGRASPPPTELSEEAVVAFVRANPGAVGYVSRSVAMSDGVKILDLDE